MNKKEQLIAEALGNNDGEHFARRAAAHVRRRRAARYAGSGTALTLAVVAVLMTFRSTQEPFQLTVIASPAKPAVEIISDQELLAQLKDQPILVLSDKTGITQVVFLAGNRKIQYKTKTKNTGS